MQSVQWNPQPVVGAVDHHLTIVQRYSGFCEEVMDRLGDLACALNSNRTGDAVGTDAMLGELRGAAEAVVQARRRVQLQGAALQELKGSYVAGGEPTDFAAHLAQRAQAAGDAQPYDAACDPLMRDFEVMAAGGALDSAGGQDEQIDEDLVIEGGAAQLAPNVTCPITQKQLLDLEDPVQDARGVVYERQAIVQFFRGLAPGKNGRSIIMAGSTHEVTLAELVPADKVKAAQRREERRRRFGGGTQRQQQQQQQQQDVLEV